MDITSTSLFYGADDRAGVECGRLAKGSEESCKHTVCDWVSLVYDYSHKYPLLCIPEPSEPSSVLRIPNIMMTGDYHELK